MADGFVGCADRNSSTRFSLEKDPPLVRPIQRFGEHAMLILAELHHEY